MQHSFVHELIPAGTCTKEIYIYLEESQPQDKDGSSKVNNIEPGTVHLNKKELMNTWIGYGT
jgi:hypothetical protein